MPTYVSLLRYTDQGIRTVKDAPQRIANAEKLFQQVGAKLSQVYLTMGRYDYVAIVEAPDEETVTKAALALGSLGNIRTETLRAYGKSEIDKIIGGLP